ncbi:MAG: prolyl oligopeptidase family serine peptidase [Gemmatimonadota bacterium]
MKLPSAIPAKLPAALLVAVLVGTFGAGAVLLNGRTPPAPETAITLVVDTLHGVEIPDAYRWLEHQNAPETRAWIDEQNEYAELIVGETPERAYFRNRLREFNDRDDVSAGQRAGEHEYFTLRRRSEQVAAIYRRPLPPETERGPIDPAGQYEKVLNPLDWSADGTTSLGILSFSPDKKLMAYSVRDGGPDEYEIRIRDLEAGTDLPEVFPPALYSGVSFTGDGSGLYYTDRSRSIGTRVKLHRLGTNISTDEVLFGEGYAPSTYADVSEEADGRYRVYGVRHGWATSEIYLQDMQTGGAIRPIVEDIDGRFYYRFIDGEIWARTNAGANNNRLVAIDVNNPAQANWRVVVPEAEDVLEDFTIIGDRLYVTYLHHASNQIRVFEKDGTPVGEVEVPALHSASIRGGEPGEAFLTLSSYTTPSTTYRFDLASGERTVHEGPEIEWDASNVVVSQVWRTSKDGTRAPMFVVHRRDIELNGQNPALLSGYGGFYNARKPGFNTTAAMFVEMGGVYAVATLRGGSEYGESWHRAGMLTNKQNVFDDFISAAEWLIENDYTSPQKLAIQGGSNGGLLVGAALTQRPDLYRVVLCGFPDLDILRFPFHTTSNSPPALLEYGDSRIPEQFEAIRQYSPVQNVRDGVAYPAVMFNTGDLDTRVPPQGARKMTASLQAASTSGHPVILSYSSRAGHAGGRPFDAGLELNAMQMAFLVDQLGVEVPLQ